MKTRIKTYHVVDYVDFNEFASDHYGREVDFVAITESSNDIEHSFSPDGVMRDYDKEELNEWLAHDSDWVSIPTILDDLVAKGLIEPGNYLIRVSW